jgi:hypothetical protein
MVLPGNTFRLRISVQLTLTYVSMHFATFLQALFMSERSVTLEVLASDSPKYAVRYTLGKLATPRESLDKEGRKRNKRVLFLILADCS